MTEITSIAAAVTSIMNMVILLWTLTYIMAIKKQKAENSHTNKSEDDEIDFGDTKLIPADKAFESTKAPELAKIVAQINDTRKHGDKRIYISNKELHEETFCTLLAVGYDIHVDYYSHSKDISTTIYFGKDASGKLTFNSAQAKQQLGFSIGRDDNFDIVEDDHLF